MNLDGVVSQLIPLLQLLGAVLLGCVVLGCVVLVLLYLAYVREQTRRVPGASS